MSIDKNLFGLLCIAILLAGCTTAPIRPSTPVGFAAYQNNENFHAISLDGVVYKVREIENKPTAELSFWKTALKKHMLDSGYHFVAESTVENNDKQEYQLELAAPVRGQDYGYLIALFVIDNRLLLVESAGIYPVINQYRDDIITVISAMSL